MTQKHSVPCPSCGASLTVTKPSLIGKRVPCPSCKTPFVIPAPADDYIPLADHTPVTPSGTPAKSGTGGSGAFNLKAANLDDIPLLADEPSSSGKSKSASAQSSGVQSSGKSSGKRADSKSDTPIRESRKGDSSEDIRPRSDSKTMKFASQAQSSEFDAMLSDSSGTDLEDEDEFKPRPPKRRGDKPDKKSAADVETTEFDSMMGDTDESDEQLGEQPAPLRRKKPRTKADADDAESIATVDMEDDYDALPPAPARSRSRGGWNVAERGPLIVWSCVGAGVLILLLLYVLFSTRPSNVPEATATPQTAAETDSKGSEVADSDKPAEKAGPAETGSTPDAAEKEAPRTPLKGSQKGAPPAAAPGGENSEEANASGQKSTGSLARNQQPRAEHTPFDVKTAVAAADAERKKPAGAGKIGREIPPFSASAIDNTTFHSADHKEQVLIVAFLGVECPLANLYAPSLAALARHYQGKSVSIIAVNSNAQDTLEQTRAQARANGLTFPVLKDAGNAVADLFGAERTPEVFVLDAQRTVRYRGMLDDQYGYRERRSRPTKTYVINAVDSLLKSEAVPVAETSVQGCHIGRVSKPSETAKSSYYRDALPILQKRCQQCHRKGEIAPFALTDYNVVRDWGPTIREAVGERRMPPWPADPKIGRFANDISLTENEIKSITQWVDDGCPEGDAAEKPPARKFVDGWNIGRPDKVYPMPQTYHVPATGVVDYQNFIVSPVFTKDTWVQAVECRFGNRSVVHHMLVLLDYPKDPSRSQDGLINGFFAAGAPGSAYFTFPDGYAKKIPKGARLRFQMHYTPNGSPAEDLSKFGIILAKGNSFREVQTFALGKADILIPAGDADHMEWASQPVPSDITLTTLMPHLHVRGKSFTFFLERPTGGKEPLLSVPQWDFNWQYQYELAHPLVVPRGSKLVVEAHWDNSANNPNNIFPLVDARFGEQTFDEMFIGYINAIPPKTVADATRPGGHAHKMHTGR